MFDIKKTNGEDFSPEEKELLGAVQKTVQNILDNAAKGVTQEQLDKAIEPLKSQVSQETIDSLKQMLESQKEALVTQGLEIEKLGNGFGLNKKEFDNAIDKALGEQLNSVDVKSQLESLFEKKNGASGKVVLTVKAPATMTVSTMGSSVSQPTYDQNIYAVSREQNRIANICNVNYINNDGDLTTTWIEQENIEGNAAITSEGSVKPLRDFEVKRKTSDMKKIAVTEKVTSELLRRVPQLRAFMAVDMTNSINDALDDAIIAKIDSAASAFSITTITTATPNNYDAIRAGVGQVRGLKGNATHVFLHPHDAANMELQKSTTDGHYLFLATTSADGRQMMISRLVVVESTQVAAGTFIVGDLSKVLVEVDLNVTFIIGYEGTEIRNNILTIVGEKFYTCEIRGVDTSKIMMDTYSNVKLAIEA